MQENSGSDCRQMVQPVVVVYTRDEPGKGQIKGEEMVFWKWEQNVLRSHNAEMKVTIVIEGTCNVRSVARECSNTAAVYWTL